MKRSVSALLALLLVVGLCVTAYAAADPSYTLTLQADNSAPAVGQEITVALLIEENGAERFALYSMQDYVCFDPAYLEYVPDSMEVYTVSSGEQVQRVLTATAQAFHESGETSINQIYIRRVDISDPVTMDSGAMLLTFRLKAVQQGVTTITHDTARVLRTSGNPYQVDEKSVTITIGQTTTSAGEHTDNSTHGSTVSNADNNSNTSGNTNRSSTDSNAGSSSNTGSSTNSSNGNESNTSGSINQANSNTGSGSNTITDQNAAHTATTVESPSTADAAEIVNHADGSTTTVETTTDGTVKTIIEKADGSTKTVEQKIDGTVTTTDIAASGVETVTVAAPGQQVTAKVTIPETVESATVTIPATLTAGTVARDADTGEIIMLSVVDENGLTLKLDSSTNIILEDNSKTFTDMGATAWASDAVAFATAHELFNGTSETSFNPEGDMTRAMLMTVLARFDGVDTDDGDTWYAAGMRWAVKQGITDGSNPNASITREQLVTMLYRYAGMPEASGSLNDYADASTVSSYAANAMAWAVDNGIINGIHGNLAPKNTATRAQVATIFQRLCALMVG